MRRVGRLYGKPVIEGDGNATNGNQILASIEGGGIVTQQT